MEKPKEMKPEINSKIYVIYRESIILDEVKWIGKEDFVTEQMLDGFIEEDYKHPLRYDEFNEKWFIELSKAKEYLFNSINIPNEDLDIVNHHNKWWEIVYEG